MARTTTRPPIRQHVGLWPVGHVLRQGLRGIGAGFREAVADSLDLVTGRTGAKEGADGAAPIAAPPAALARMTASVPPAITGPRTGMMPAVTPSLTSPPSEAPATAPVTAPVAAPDPWPATAGVSVTVVLPSLCRPAIPIWFSAKPAWYSSLMAATAWARSSKTPITVERRSVLVATRDLLVA